MTSHLITQALEEHISAIETVPALAPAITEAAALVTDVLLSEGKLLICGNGGSAADAQHFAAELTGRFETERQGYPAIALTTDTSALTAISNDYGFERIFSRQVEALSKPGDLLFVISTSGNSENLVHATETAQCRGVKVIGLLGRDGGLLAQKIDLPIVVGAPRTASIQEVHIFIIHLLCTLFEAQA
ncbi:MAG: D-sedoheptulose 7-phosphate isomerase [Pseudomonadota bacterium]